MTVGWVAVTARGRSLLGGLVGDKGAHRLGSSRSWSDARTQLSTTFYGAELPSTADRATARQAAHQAVMWQLRVLASWLPPANGRLAHLAAAPFEISNFEHHLSRLAGTPAPDPIQLGPLGAAWPRLSTTNSAEQLRLGLARSAWRDPGGTTRAAFTLGLRVAWGRRVAASIPSARAWAHGGVASLIARELFVFGRDINDVTGRDLDRLFGGAWREAASLPDLSERLPVSANWSLEGISTVAEVWRSEVAVLRRVSHDARPIAHGGPPAAETVAAIIALLLVDLWRVTASIEAAGRGPNATEVLDAVA
jgi:hypothetical protein